MRRGNGRSVSDQLATPSTTKPNFTSLCLAALDQIGIGEVCFAVRALIDTAADASCM